MGERNRSGSGHRQQDSQWSKTADQENRQRAQIAHGLCPSHDLWGTRVSCSTPADVDKKIDRRIETRRSKPIEAAAPLSTGRCGNEVTTTNTKLAGERPRPQL